MLHYEPAEDPDRETQNIESALGRIQQKNALVTLIPAFLSGMQL